jgi:hypothetical protein
VLTGFGLWVIYRQVLATTPNVWLIFTGVAFASPAAFERLRRITGSVSGSSGSSSPQPPPAPSPASPGSAGE